MEKNVARVSNSNANVFNSYIKMHKDNPSSMKGVYQIYERGGYSFLPLETVIVRYYDVSTGNYLGFVK